MHTWGNRDLICLNLPCFYTINTNIVCYNYVLIWPRERFSQASVAHILPTSILFCAKRESRRERIFSRELLSFSCNVNCILLELCGWNGSFVWVVSFTATAFFKLNDEQPARHWAGQYFFAESTLLIIY